MNREAEFRNVARRVHNLARDIPNIYGSDEAHCEYHTLIAARDLLLTLLKSEQQEHNARSGMMRKVIAYASRFTPQRRTMEDVLCGKERKG